MIALSGLGCSTLPRGAGAPKSASFALDRPEDTRLGQQVLEESRQHRGESGFHIINAGIDGFVARVQLARAAERTLDLQYFIFRGDQTGSMMADELVRAADRGVRVRILVDDGDTLAGDERILALGGHPNIEVRIFNPFDYRGHNAFLRHLDFVFHKGRLDYRMHNKLMVADNAVALVGGRNIGNQYFQIDPDSQFADDDVFAAGEIAQRLSKTFDEFWNSQLAVPATALPLPRSHPGRAAHVSFHDSGIDYRARVASGQPLALVSDDTGLTWSHAAVVCDSPDKKDVVQRKKSGRLMAPEVTAAIGDARQELLMVTPYFVPSEGELARLEQLRQRGARVRILSNSLESAPDLPAQSGYVKFRAPLLEAGVELYEVRALLDRTQGSGQTRAVSRYGTYALHAKLYVMDRQRFYIGSMNYDQRSLRINTEVGLIIDSPALAQQTARRFDNMVTPQEAYRVNLRREPSGKAQLVWDTELDHRPVELTHEPSRGWWQREKLKLIALLPIDREL